MPVQQGHLSHGHGRGASLSFASSGSAVGEAGVQLNLPPRYLYTCTVGRSRSLARSVAPWTRELLHHSAAAHGLVVCGVPCSGRTRQPRSDHQLSTMELWHSSAQQALNAHSAPVVRLQIMAPEGHA